MKASVKTIAGLTGFSPATVSNALNYKKGVNKETAAKIFQTARELGYLEENRVTKVKFVKYKKNGLIVDDTPFFPLLIDGVAEECRASGLEMAVCTLDSRDASYEEQVKWLLNDRASAVILLGTELMEEDLDIYRGAACPLLLLDNWSADMSFNGVLINNSDSARMATEYLIKRPSENRIFKRRFPHQSVPVQSRGISGSPYQSRHPCGKEIRSDPVYYYGWSVPGYESLSGRKSGTSNRLFCRQRYDCIRCHESAE